MKVLRFVIAQDVGRALNPALVEGQMRGGVVQGIGWALYEELIYDDQAQLLAGSFMDYALPRADHGRRSRRSSSRFRRPTARSAPRASARRRSAAPGRGRERHRGGRRSAHARSCR